MGRLACGWKWRYLCILLLTNAIHSNGYAYNVLVQLSDKCCPFITADSKYAYFLAVIPEMNQGLKRRGAPHYASFIGHKDGGLMNILSMQMFVAFAEIIINWSTWSGNLYNSFPIDPVGQNKNGTGEN